MRLALGVVVICLLAAGAYSSWPRVIDVPPLPDPPPSSAAREPIPFLGTAGRAAAFRFATGTSAADRRRFLRAVASARSDARRLLGLVDGFVTVRFTDMTAAGMLGATRFKGGRYRVQIDGRRLAQLGMPEFDTTVLHELGHVVDRALVTSNLRQQLIGVLEREACADPEGGPQPCLDSVESFAETFAIWALQGRRTDRGTPDRVLPPSLSAWGEPLARLGRSLTETAG